MLVEPQTQKVRICRGFENAVVARVQENILANTSVCISGKATRGYDPSQDIEWLHSEIVRWVLGNLMQRW